MRAEKRDPRQVYEDFWDWLQTGYNMVWLFSIVLGYIYYLVTTQEV